MVTDTIARSRPEACRMLKISENTLVKWEKLEGFPGKPGRQGKRGDGHYPIGKILDWRDRYFGADGKGGTRESTNGLTLNEVKIADVLEQTRGRKMKNDTTAGQLYTAEAVDMAVAEILSELRGRVEMVADDIRMMIPETVWTEEGGEPRTGFREYVASEVDERLRLALTEAADKLEGRSWAIGSVIEDAGDESET